MRGNHTKRKTLKKIILRNVAIVVCVIIVAISLYILVRPNENDNTISDIKSRVCSWFSWVNNVKSKEISEKDARKRAVEEFEKLGEKVEADSLQVFDLERDEQMNFYIKSEENTMEIRKSDGKIVRLNAKIVNE